jgi:hypothetical protein
MEDGGVPDESDAGAADAGTGTALGPHEPGWMLTRAGGVDAGNGSQDAGGSACIPQDEDCAKGDCCDGLLCAPAASGYTRQIVLL